MYRVTVNDRAGERGGKDAPDKASAKRAAAVARVKFPGCVVVIYDLERDGRAVDEASEEWLDASRWGVWCRVSGGVTGTREAWLKRSGVLAVFASEAEAAAEALALTVRMNHEHSVASFQYRAAPLRE